MVSIPARTGVRRLVTAVFFFSIFTNILMFTGPLFMLQVYDRVLAARSEETLSALLILVVFLYFLYWLLEFSRARLMSRVGARFQANLNRRIFRLTMERAALRRGAPRGRLQDIDAIRTFFSSPVFLALMDLPWSPLFLGALFVFHPLLGSLGLAGGCLLILITIANQFVTQHRVRESGLKMTLAQGFARQAEGSAELLWAQGMRANVTERWVDMQNRAVMDNTHATDWTGAFTSFARAFRLLLQSGMLALGAWLVLRQELSSGAMVASSVMLGRGLSPIETTVSQWMTVQRARIGWRDLRQMMESMPERDEPTPLPAPRSRLVLNNVSLVARRGDPPVLTQVGFSVEPGEAVGVIGKSGSGKTTLARVVMGLVQPTSGDIRLDGATLDQFGVDRLGRHVGYLPQDISLMDGTVSENIAQMAENPDPARVVEAARRARVHDIILRLPEGYDTRITANDLRLSGGQRQRVALARALFGDPALLVLDEPNSNLDADGSEALNAAVNTMKAEGKAVLIMTHRPTAISACDKLLILDGGRVAAFGPRDTIIKAMMKNATEVQRMVREKRA